MGRKGNRYSIVKSKYNLYAVCDELNINMAEIASLANVSKQTCYKYMWNGTSGKESADAIEEVILSLTDNPEDYLWEKWENYKSTKGRKKGSKNKNGPVRIIKPTEEEVARYINPDAPKIKNIPLIKISISDIDSFITCLKQGTKIFMENNSNYIQLTENFIIKYNNKDEPLFINPAIDIKEKYYWLKRETLNIVIGKIYITENNKEVTIFSSKEDTYFGVINGYNDVFTYNKEGQIINKSSDFNIKGEKL